MKPSIFIGSSSEQLPVAKEIKAYLTSRLECKVWDEGVFRLGESHLASLMRAIRAFDFALLICAGDDYLETREEAHLVPRDNVIFELGLFIGAAGPGRAFPVLISEGQDTSKLPSDLHGQNVLYLNALNAGELTPKAKGLLDDFAQMVEKEFSENADFQILPSTGIAVGYYYNFLEPVCQLLARGEPVRLSENSDEGSFVYSDYIFEVLIPSSLREANWQGAQHHTQQRRLQRVQVQNPGGHRPFPFFTEAQTNADGVTVFTDYPTTLRSSDEAVDLIFGTSSLRTDDLRQVFDQKEIANFRKTLRLLIEREVGAISFRDRVKFRRVES